MDSDVKGSRRRHAVRQAKVDVFVWNGGKKQHTRQDFLFKILFDSRHRVLTFESL